MIINKLLNFTKEPFKILVNGDDYSATIGYVVLCYDQYTQSDWLLARVLDKVIIVSNPLRGLKWKYFIHEWLITGDNEMDLKILHAKNFVNIKLKKQKLEHYECITHVHTQETLHHYILPFSNAWCL
jgi:hypothetical protein